MDRVDGPPPPPPVAPAPKKQRRRRGAAFGPILDEKRATRGRNPTGGGALPPRSNSRKSLSARGRRRSGPSTNKNQPVRQWVQVHRAPGNQGKIQFAVQQWVLLQDLTEEEREKYVPAAGAFSTLSSSQPNDSFTGMAAAAPKMAPRPSSVTFAMDAALPLPSTNSDPSGDVLVTENHAITTELVASEEVKDASLSTVPSTFNDQVLTLQQTPQLLVDQPQDQEHIIFEPEIEAPSSSSPRLTQEDENKAKRSASPTADALAEQPLLKRQRTDEVVDETA